MSKKVFSFLAVMLVVLLVVLSIPRVGMSGAMPEAGDAVYRDLGTNIVSAKLIGHAGVFIGNFEVVHMQYPKVQKVALTNFYVDYWGSFYTNNYDVAQKIAKEAKNLLSKNVKYSFFNYKSFGSKYAPKGRCDGLDEWCYEKGGIDITNDYHWSALSPQMQWKSGAITRRYTTTRGTEAKNSALVDIGSWLENLL